MKNTDNLKANLRAERAAGLSPRIWMPKKWGVTSFRPFSFESLRRRVFANIRSMIELGMPRDMIANAAEGWHLDGLMTFLVTDAPYTFRYSLEQFSTAAQPAGIPYTYPPNALAMQYPIANGGIPLGICADEPTTGLAGTLDSQPVPVQIQTLGAARKTLVGVTDSVVAYNNYLLPSTTTAGQLKSAAGLAAGVYVTVGMSLSTSEGAGAQIEFDPRPGVFSVDEIT